MKVLDVVVVFLAGMCLGHVCTMVPYFLGVR